MNTFIRFELCLNLYETLLEMIKHVNGRHSLMDLENINFTFLSQNEQPLSGESSLLDFRFSRKLFADLYQIFSVFLVYFFNLD